MGYIRRLEEVLIKTVGMFDIHAQRVDGLTGVWVNMKGELAKLAAIGVHISARGVSTHGIALNVNPEMHYFDGIVPCGIHDKAVCSMEMLLGNNTPAMTEVKAVFAECFSTTFHVNLSACSPENLLETSQ